MARLRSGEVQVNIALPKELIDQVIDYQFSNRLKHQKEAYRELLENGLRNKKKQEALKP